MEKLKIIIPIENHPTNVQHLVVLLNNIKEVVKRDHEVIIVNHNDSKLPEGFLKSISSEYLININLTNDKFYYKNESYFMLKPEIFKYIIDRFEPPYFFIDPDNIILKDIPPLGTGEVLIYETPLEGYSGEVTKLLLEMFQMGGLDIPFKHFNTHCIYTDSKEFVKDWYKTSKDIALFGKHHINKTLGNRYQHFCEELAVTLLCDKYDIKNKYFDGYLDKFEKPGPECVVYHYDFYDNLKKLNDKYSRIYRYFGNIPKHKATKDAMIEDFDLVRNEIKRFIFCAEEPKSQPAKNILRWNEEYNFNE